VCDEESCPLLADPAHGALDLILCFAVEGHAALSDFGIVAVYEAANELVCLSFAGGFLDHFFCGVIAPEGDVVGEVSCEKEDVLFNGRNLGAQRFHAPLPHIDPVDKNSEPV